MGQAVQGQVVQGGIVQRLTIRAVAAALLLAIAGGAAEAKRVALVIGNDAYRDLFVLERAVNDARAVAEALEEMDFTVIKGENVSRRETNRLLADLDAAISPGDQVFFFFAGHGVAIGAENYLLPVDMPKPGPGEEGLVRDEGHAVNAIVERVLARGAAASFFILDACRDNPFAAAGVRNIGVTRGLNRVPAPLGVFVLFSAGIGQAALDRLSAADSDPNSVFTRRLVPLLRTPGLTHVTLAKTVQREVDELARTVPHPQQPAYYDQIIGEIVLKPAPAAPAAPAMAAVAPRATAPAEPTVQSRVIEVVPAVADPSPAPATAAPPATDAERRQREAFALADEGGRVEDYDRFLREHPRGAFAEQARRAIAELEHFAVAERAGDIAGFRAFLDAHAEGPRADKARERIAAIERQALAADCDGYAGAAMRSVAEAQSLNCRAFGEAWSSTQSVHVSFCMAASKEDRAALDRQRADGLAACRIENDDHEAWRTAEAHGSAKAVSDYLTTFPNGRNVEAARTRLAALEKAAWERLGEKAEPSSYEEYLKAWPDGTFAAEARAKIAAHVAEREARDDKAWAEARAKGGARDYAAYLDAWPNGRHSAEARPLAEEFLAWREASALGSVAAYRIYLAAHPNGVHAEEARALIEPPKDFRDVAIFVPGSVGRIVNATPRAGGTQVDLLVDNQHEALSYRWDLKSGHFTRQARVDLPSGPIPLSTNLLAQIRLAPSANRVLLPAGGVGGDARIGQLNVFDIATKRLVRTIAIPGQDAEVHNYAISADGAFVAADVTWIAKTKRSELECGWERRGESNRDYTIDNPCAGETLTEVQIWSVASGGVVRRLPAESRKGSNSWTRALGFSGSPAGVVIAYEDGILRWHGMQSGAQAGGVELDSEAYPVMGIETCGAGFITTGGSNFDPVWTFQGGRPKMTAFVPYDGGRYSCLNDRHAVRYAMGTVTLIDLKSGKELAKAAILSDDRFVTVASGGHYTASEGVGLRIGIENRRWPLAEVPAYRQKFERPKGTDLLAVKPESEMVNLVVSDGYSYGGN